MRVATLSEQLKLSTEALHVVAGDWASLVVGVRHAQGAKSASCLGR